jgi:hypothetical protein
MPRLFINYRRADSQGFAGRMYDRLAKVFGRGNIFMDVETLQPGEKFVEAIVREATARDVMLVLIGPQWLNKTRETKKSRLDDSDDYVRREIETALNSNMHVIPILLQGATLPSSESLPKSLHSLLACNACVIGNDFHSDVGQLIRRIKQIADPKQGKQILIGRYFCTRTYVVHCGWSPKHVRTRNKKPMAPCDSDITNGSSVFRASMG